MLVLVDDGCVEAVKFDVGSRDLFIRALNALVELHGFSNF
jgi:hypothetical protein